MYDNQDYGFTVHGILADSSFSSLSNALVVFEDFTIIRSVVGNILSRGGRIVAEDSVLGSVNGSLMLSAKRCAFSSLSSTTFTDTFLEISDSSLDGAGNKFSGIASGKIISSVISGGVSVSSGSSANVSVFDSRIDGVLSPYTKVTNRYSRMSSPEYRVGGAGSSIKTIIGHTSDMIDIDEFYSEYIPGSSYLTAFVSTSFDILDRITAVMRYSDGSVFSSSDPVVLDYDNSSQWNGIPSDAVPIYAKFDLSTVYVKEGSLVNIVFFIDGGDAVTIWSDPTIKYE